MERAPAAGALLPPATTGSGEAHHEPARDTLAPSSFGVLGKQQAVAPAPSPQRGPRQQLNTLGEIEGVSATATLRPPGAVPPPPRGLPQPTPPLDGGWDRASARDTPVPGAPLFAGLAAELPAAPAELRSPVPARDLTLQSGVAAPRSTAGGDRPLDSTLDVNGSASRKATQAALLEQTRAPLWASSTPFQGAAAAETAGSAADVQAGRSSGVPAPGLYIADEPLEPRPPQLSLVTEQRRQIDRMRTTLLVLGGLLLAAAGALSVLVVRRAERKTTSAAASQNVAPVTPPGCALVVPPSRISPIERSVPISAVTQSDGTIALGIADSKASAAGWIYEPAVGETRRKLAAPTAGGDVSHVTAAEPLVVDRASPDFAFAQTLAPGLALGVGPTGVLRRGADGATGEVWPLAAGDRVTPPRVASNARGHFVAFRRGGAEGQIVAGWLNPDGSAAGPPSVVEGAPKSLGTPNVALFANRGVVLFSARRDRSEPYRVFAARVAPGERPEPARALDLPAAGGGAIAPSLVALSSERYLVQWTDGSVGQYQVHVRLFDLDLAPRSAALQVSAKGANAGQGMLVAGSRFAVSFFIQTTAGHDELWGASLACH